MEALQLTLDTIFEQKIWRHQSQLHIYEKLYNLPRLQYLQHTCHDSLLYAKKKSAFVIIVLYTDDGKIYMQYDWSWWWLPWWSVYHTEDFYDAIKRITKRISPHIMLSQVEPILLVDNTFCHKDQAHTLHGIVYTARIIQEHSIVDMHHGNYLQVNDDLINNIQKYGNKDILLYIQNTILPRIIEKNILWQQDEEITTNLAMQKRYWFHNTFCKPLLKLFGISKNTFIKKRIEDECKNATYILDASCGDDTLTKNLAKNTERIVVANDISWSQIELIHTQKENLIFTNHSATHLPYKKQVFDVVICKNTMHHMENREQLMTLLKSLKYIAKKVLIVEIENPKKSHRFAKFLHTYWYSKFLQDVWHAYLTAPQALQIINTIFDENYTIKYWKFESLQWNYFWASITAL